MGKRGPKSKVEELTNEICRILSENPSSVKEIQKKIRNRNLPKSYPAILKALKILINCEEVTVKEVKEGRGSIPKKIYELKGKGIEKAEKSKMLSDHSKKLKELSKNELVDRLCRYEFVEAYNRLDIEQRIVVLQLLSEQDGEISRGAIERLKMIKKEVVDWDRFRNELNQASPDEYFEILMKYRRKRDHSESKTTNSKERRGSR